MTDQERPDPNPISPGEFNVLESRTDALGWARQLCVLLDSIEMLADEPEQVRRLCKQRFDIARHFGMALHFGGPTSGASH